MTKKYEELSFTDDFMFGKIMYHRMDLCKELLELILDRKIRRITYPEPQKTVEITADAKGVRFDIYTEDDKDTVYDVEMQTVANQELPKRSRYYHGMLDLNQMEKGMPYRQLKTCYVIFICKDDLGELPRYTYRMRCEEDLGQYLEDGTYTVFLNAHGDTPDLTKGMREFLAYIREGSVPEDPESFVSRLHQSVAEAREHKEWRLEYMTLQMRDEQMREEGREQGREQGWEAGSLQARRETAYELYDEDGFSPEKIAKRIKVSAEQVRQWLDERAAVPR